MGYLNQFPCLEDFNDATYNKQSESAKRGMSTVTGDLGKDRKHHTMASVGIATVDGKMPEGKEKNAHSLACVWIATVDSKMPEGQEKNAHSLASVGIGTVDTKSLHNAPGQGEECALACLCVDRDG